MSPQPAETPHHGDRELTVAFTVGHGALTLDELISELKDHNVGWVVDVRSTPYSRRYPHFNRRELAAALKRNAIRYAFLGDRLGGRPTGQESSQWAQGKLDEQLVAKLSKSERWRKGIDIVARSIRNSADHDDWGCLMCSESDPRRCHRSLISFQLQDAIPGLEIEHIHPVKKSAEASFQNPLFITGGEHESRHH